MVPLTSVTEENDLGICFDNMLEFDKHINSEINKAISDTQSFPISRQTNFNSFCCTKHLNANWNMQAVCGIHIWKKRHGRPRERLKKKRATSQTNPRHETLN